ncbi:hypothetical protein BH23GEM9_BH23GEM9_31290 [soil metagenome]
MMRRFATLILVPAVMVACGDRAGPEPPATDPATAEPTAEYGTTLDDVPANDPATIAFIQEGRTLHFGGREWIMVGEPIYNPILRHVGTAEGVELYASPTDRIMPATLFFHLGNDRWQTLQVAGGVSDVADDTLAVPPDTLRAPPR